MFQGPGKNAKVQSAMGVAVDSRTPKRYFAWVAGDKAVVRIPASDTPLPNGQDVLVDGANYPAVKIAGQGKGVGVDRAQNVWNVSGDSSATRILVDAQGNMKWPDIFSPPIGANRCPAGDRCNTKDSPKSSPAPYTYSDFTGFGLTNFTDPKGFYSYLQEGCVGVQNGWNTRWIAVDWDAVVPPNTTLAVRARSGATAKPDDTWGAWTLPFPVSPADLIAGDALSPNYLADAYLQVEFHLTSNDQKSAPTLKSFHILFACDPGI
ncbi:MAG: hypothetical protein EXR72_16300 [Myxococcales bacterium]|nr:hypothetical protein [Myxococcales bacterium]